MSVVSVQASSLRSHPFSSFMFLDLPSSFVISVEYSESESDVESSLAFAARFQAYVAKVARVPFGFISQH